MAGMLDRAIGAFGETIGGRTVNGAVVTLSKEKAIADSWAAHDSTD